MRHREADFKSIPHSSLGELGHAQIAFKNSVDNTEQIRIAERVEAHNSPSHLYTAGAMFLDVATSDALPAEQKVEYIVRAHHNWENTLQLTAVINQHPTEESHQASVGLACLPLWQRLAIERKNPSLSKLEVAYKSLIGIGTVSLAGYRSLGEKGVSYVDPKRGDLRGRMSEISVLLLLQRFALREMASSDWLAVPSLISQDINRGTKASPSSKAWDLSVFTQPSPEAASDLSYKIQVKTKRTPKHVYDPDITVVDYSTDLTSHAGSSTPIGIIIRQCAEEQETDSDRVTSELDRATEKLLEVLG